MDDEAILRELRAFPLYDFDVGRVGVRAYALGATSSDSFLNWLQAEREETVVQCSESLLFSAGSREFLERYALVDKVRFVANTPMRKSWRGERPAMRCAICGASHETGATFRTEAHLLPACTGNRFLLVTEECDACNLGSGRSAETDLGNMLAPHRAFGRIQTRSKPSTTLRLGDGDSSVGGQKGEEPLRLQLVEGSTTVQVHDVGSNALRVDVQTMSYRPISALRALGKVAWHLLSDDLRVDHKRLLDWVKVEPSVGRGRYVRIFIPGPGLRHTTFAVWSRKPGMEPADGPSLIYLLALADLILVIPDPDWMNAGGVIPVPPLPAGYGVPELTTVTATSDEKVSPTISYTINYLSRTLDQTAKPLPVRATATLDGAQTSIECDLVVVPGPSPRQRCYVLCGGQLCGQLSVTTDPLRLSPEGEIIGGTNRLAYELALDDSSGDTNVTMRFVEIVSTGARLEIVAVDAKRIVCNIQLAPVQEFSLDALREAFTEFDASRARSRGVAG